MNRQALDTETAQVQQILNTLANARSAARIARSLVAAGIMVWAVAPSPALAQTTAPPDFGLDWVTVGAPGNPPVPDGLYIWAVPPNPPLGTVDYEYRIMRTEITVAQWFEFVQSYVSVFGDQGVNTSFHGLGIGWSPSGYFLRDPPDFPNTMSWEFAARYANWLHNGKVLTAEAFENGAYDTSTFTTNPDGTLNHQDGHHPGALYWIPTHDEWVKAVYYDPDRFGPGQSGYWYNPGSQDALLISGPPGVGQTNAGSGAPESAVGSYPNVQSPWGLLDTSGGTCEWSETKYDLKFGMFRRGSSADDFSYQRSDPIDRLRHQLPDNPFPGLRLASAIQIPPCPGDANIDGQVNFSDITSALGNWQGDGATGGDANGDGVVNFADITSVLTNWQGACP